MKIKSLLFAFFLSAMSLSAATVEVSSVPEFLNAIQPGNTIVLAPGEYVFSDHSDLSGDYFYFSEAYDGMELVISNVSGLTIKGSGTHDSHLITRPSYGFVMRFNSCQGIDIENIKAGHGPEKGYCTGGVLEFTSSQGITIQDCFLYGSGIEGLTLNESQGITVTSTYITGCTYSIMSMYNSQAVTFNKCKFWDNVEFEMVNISACNAVSFKKCKFRKNRTSGYEWSNSALFNVTESNAVSVSKCQFEDNEADHLATSPSQVSLKGNKMSGNNFRKGDFKDPK